MKFQIAASALLAASTLVQASPVIFETGNISNISNGSNHSNSTFHNGTNATDFVEPKLKVIVTGGTYTLKNSSDVEYNFYGNSSNALNFTQLYEVAEIVNKTLDNDNYYGVVVVANGNSVESLGFFSTILFDSIKPVVVAQDADYGLLVANNTGAYGSLVVSNDYLVYSGAFSPAVSRYATDAASGVPIAACGDDLSVNWFFDDSTPMFTDPFSVIRNQFPELTNANVTTEFNFTPRVPIVSQSDCSLELLSTLEAAADGVVIISTEGDARSLDLSSLSIPVVFAKGDQVPYLSSMYLPEGTCGAGYLSPLKAQLLLTVALANGISSAEELITIFP
ncbi:hypothetical protein Kpol_1035p31 [Vanderwaltozyma polyspora DSM 70294]|uniref:Asparaginase n=1 Tax=Vanderwaltozyma polyspora (strain ATCC 22028 / DSM 70294 / BCRC 21397 / CBS 2163 / NBRC 10782 / NRRL Y-8283 / UCD 57-17) TaxID=436907 RepID=A7TKJ6_VANPO|nr:uncharacterized protein Kpol_1035p31 [Vanderwaltozyma polyspora DSM 70294]EDO17218.1 hypothetical protein Kpol_1035p31 [Vanderwaltozyma polyspora DSM 70294]